MVLFLGLYMLAFLFSLVCPSFFIHIHTCKMSRKPASPFVVSVCLRMTCNDSYSTMTFKREHYVLFWIHGHLDQNAIISLYIQSCSATMTPNGTCKRGSKVFWQKQDCVSRIQEFCRSTTQVAVRVNHLFQRNVLHSDTTSALFVTYGRQCTERIGNYMPPTIPRSQAGTANGSPCLLTSKPSTVL